MDKNPITILLLSFLATSHAAGLIVTYWGQESTSDSLAATCDTGYYGAVILSFLSTFGNGQTPSLDLSCSPDCTALESDITHCQSNGTLILLAIGGDGSGTYGLNSTDDAKNTASYLWENYLGGKPSTGIRQLGENTTLDGIAFFIRKGTNLYWNDLAMELQNYIASSTFDILLAASPQCPYPDPYIAEPLTNGYFLAVGVQFFDNPSCDYSSGLDNFTSAWNLWTTSVKAHFYLQLPASPDVVSTGYISPDVLVSQVVPLLNQSGSYAGVALWDAYYAKINNYTQDIYGKV